MSLLAELSTPLNSFILFVGIGMLRELSKNECTYQRPDGLRASPQGPSFLCAGMGLGSKGQPTGPHLPLRWHGAGVGGGNRSTQQGA